MNLIIDIGNTAAKYYIFSSGKIVYNHQSTSDEIIDFSFLYDKFPEIENVIISSVATDKINIPNKIKKNIQTLIYLDENTPLPIKNNYQTKSTLGKDRIAAIVGAYNIFPNSNVLVIDAGTAITFDFINKNAEYEGGNISPGLNMRFKALHEYTKRLPLVSQSSDFQMIGTSTKTAIEAGVQYGIIFEIDAYIDKFKAKYPNLEVILTGGDAFFFANKLKNRIFANSNLTALGLNRILENNVKKI